MFDVGGGELLLILLVILLLFGPKKIPEFAQQVGRGIRQFRRAQEDLTQQIRDISAEAAMQEQRPPRVTPPDAEVQPRQTPSAPPPLPPTETP
jgi:TatA/E family protein of Tat protein translocase